MIYVKGIIMSPGSRDLGVGYQCTISARISPTNATNKTIVWKSEDPTIATVNATTGIITGKKAGVVRIFACATDGSGVEGRAAIEVVDPMTHVTSIDLYPDAVVEAKAGESIYHITANILPTNATMRDVIWSSSNEEVATVSNVGVVTTHKDGVAQITATTVDGNLSDSCTINVDSREIATIEKDGNFNKVVFENGKIWHCINCDMIFNEENAFNEVLSERNGINCFVDPYDHNTEKKIYTDNELVFLYTIDPCGVAKYVDTCTRSMSLSEALSYKDQIFRLFYNRTPNYFARNTSGNWYITEEKSNLNIVLSESETLFGMHNIYDYTTIKAYLTLALDITSILLGGVIDEITDIVINTILKFIGVETDIKFYNEFKESFIGTSMGWLNDFVSLYNDLEEIAEAITIDKNFYPHFVRYFVSNVNYRVYIKLYTGESVEMKTIEEAIEKL